MDRDALPPILRLLIGGACAVIVLAAMRVAAPLLVPLLLTLMVVLATTPTILRLQQRGIPPRLAILGLYAVLVGVGLVLLVYFGLLVREFSGNLPDYEAKLQTRMTAVQDTLVDAGAPVSVRQLNGSAVTGFVLVLADKLSGTVGIAVVVFPAAMLILLDSPRIVARIPDRLGSDDRVLHAFNEFRRSIIDFCVISTRVGLGRGAGVAVWLLLLGVDFPLFLGMFTFVTSYIPGIGLLLAVIPAVAMAWVQYGWGRAAVVAVGFLAISMAVGAALGNRVVRRRLDLSGATIFLGAFFWAWVLGPAGALLAAPIMALIKVVLESSPETRWLAVLISARYAEPSSGEGKRAKRFGSRSVGDSPAPQLSPIRCAQGGPARGEGADRGHAPTARG
ncbi:MAG: AI-2E family transporter [Dehalococcoidia bacterium]